MSESELRTGFSLLNVCNETFDPTLQADNEKEYVEEEPRNIIIGMLSQIKKGMDLHKVPFPTFVLEPRSMLERITDFVSHPQLILNTPEKIEGLDRFLDVVKYYLSGWHIRPKGAKKPFNPVLGEVFRCKWVCDDSSISYYISEQVSHHPPTSAYFYANPENNIVTVGNFSPKPKFLGNSIVSVMKGQTHMYFLNRPGEDYICTYPNIYARGLLFGTMFLELGDDSTIICESLDLKADISFKIKGYFSGSSNGVTAKICQKSTGKLLKTITGKWSEKLYISDPTCPEAISLFLDVAVEPICSKIVLDESIQDKLESRRLWHDLTKYLKERDYSKASIAKSLVEDDQRRLARTREENGISWNPKFFVYKNDGFWHFCDQHVLEDSNDRNHIKSHLEELMALRDFDFKRGGISGKYLNNTHQQ